MLVVKQVTKGYRSRTGLVAAVEGVSFEVGPGEILAFLGPNGAGKTTTIKMAAGLITPDSGTATVDGHDMVRDRARALRTVGAVLEGSRNLYWRMTPLENLVYWGMMRGVPAAEARTRGVKLLERVGLGAKLRATVQTLSRGMQQKVALCTALVHAPRLLLLDEPTLGLDWRSGEDIKDLVRELRDQGTGILLTTHQLDVAEELSDRVAVIERGRLVLEGRMAEVLQRFSRQALRVTLARPLLPEEELRLRAFGFEPDPIHPTDVLCTAVGREVAGMMEILTAFDGLPVESVARDRAHLTAVFEQVVALGRKGPETGEPVYPSSGVANAPGAGAGAGVEA